MQAFDDSQLHLPNKLPVVRKLNLGLIEKALRLEAFPNEVLPAFYHLWAYSGLSSERLQTERLQMLERLGDEVIIKRQLTVALSTKEVNAKKGNFQLILTPIEAMIWLGNRAYDKGLPRYASSVLEVATHAAILLRERELVHQGLEASLKCGQTLVEKREMEDALRVYKFIEKILADPAANVTLTPQFHTDVRNGHGQICETIVTHRSSTSLGLLLNLAPAAATGQMVDATHSNGVVSGTHAPPQF